MKKTHIHSHEHILSMYAQRKKCSGNRLASQLHVTTSSLLGITIRYSQVYTLWPSKNAPFFPIPEILDILHVQKADNHILKRMVGLTMVPSSMQGNNMPTD